MDAVVIIRTAVEGCSGRSPSDDGRGLPWTTLHPNVLNGQSKARNNASEHLKPPPKIVTRVARAAKRVRSPKTVLYVRIAHRQQYFVVLSVDGKKCVTANAFDDLRVHAHGIALGARTYPSWHPLVSNQKELAPPPTVQVFNQWSVAWCTTLKDACPDCDDPEKRREWAATATEAVRVLGGKWKIVIIIQLLSAEGPLRFSELERQIEGVNQKMLIQQLKQLETDGIVVRTLFPQVPPKVEYSLSEAGYALKPALGALMEWALARGQTYTG